MKSRTPIRRISEKRLKEEFGGRVPFSTISHRPKRGKAPLKVYADGREVCNLATVEGRNLYKGRIKSMLFRQKFFCCNCKLPLMLSEATFEHEFGRGMGGSRRDDRIEINGQRVNGASHLECNSERGSKRTPIWHGEARAGVRSETF